MHPTVERFQSFYSDLKHSSENLSADNLNTYNSNPKLQALYSDDITFIDPVHSISGIQQLAAYLQGNCQQLISCRFEVESINQLPGEAYIHWRMSYQHPKLIGGRISTIDGISHIKFDDKVHYHRDYFDMGAMIYQKLPLIGPVIRYIKNRMQA